MYRLAAWIFAAMFFGTGIWLFWSKTARGRLIHGCDEATQEKYHMERILKAVAVLLWFVAAMLVWVRYGAEVRDAMYVILPIFLIVMSIIVLSLLINTLKFFENK